MKAWTLLCRLAMSALVTAALTAALPSAFAAAPQLRSQAPGYYRIMVGDYEVTALLDGTHPFPVNDVMSNVKESDGLLAAADLSAPVEGSINAFLINTGSKLILIDSGAGVLYGACCGHLLENMRASGYQPEQVDEVYLTHLHRDHVGGVNHDGGMAFPNAIVRVNKIDTDFWLNRDHEASVPTYLDTMFDGAIDSLKPYIAAGKLVPFEGTTELSPGIRSIPSPGHTPGHTSFEVESSGQKILMWGDIVHVAQIQFTDPTVTVKYDSDAKSAERQRQMIFADAAKNGYLIAADHISFPGLGHILTVGKNFVWAPVTYTTVFAGAAH